MALFSPLPTALSTLSLKPELHLVLPPKRNLSLLVARFSAGSGAGMVGSAAGGGGAAKAEGSKFEDPRWVGGTWDLKQFEKNGKTDWDAVIDAEARRRKWLEDYPEASSNEESIGFDTSIIPWWAWIKRFHLPESERLNGRAAMIGFFMAYLVDSLTGLGLVDQMGNFFCKTLLFMAVVWVLLIRENKDIENLKNILEETAFYDKQWQATWQDDTTSDSNNDLYLPMLSAFTGILAIPDTKMPGGGNGLRICPEASSNEEPLVFDTSTIP